MHCCHEYHQQGSFPKFSSHFYCGQTAGCINMPLGMEVGLSPEDFVLDGYPATLPTKGAEPPKFSAHVYCSQMAAWIKIPLGMEVGLGSDHMVLDGEPSCPPQKGAEFLSPIFGPCLLWPNGWIDQDAT